MLFISNQIIRLAQIGLWLYSKWLVKYCLTVTTHSSRLDLIPGKQRLIISNHVSRHDPFIIIGMLSWQEMSVIRPIRPMLARAYYYSPLLLPAYLLGCYPTKPLLPFLRRYAGTIAAVRFAKHGCTLGIFPEGRRVEHSESPAAPRFGVIKILQQLDAPEILLAKVTRDARNRRHYMITLVRDDSTVSASAPEEIMDKIFSLGHTN